MSIVKQISDWPRRPPARLPLRSAPKQGVSAEIHILPCIRREPLVSSVAQTRYAGSAS